ncbi:hypothetical protein PSAB6_450039 [Paraburkholderia sabiae]|nr:hypothetical protein PSAB6_450039 [Paraburkholderia sabiae]
MNFQVSCDAAMGRKEGKFGVSSFICLPGRVCFVWRSLVFAGIRDAFSLFTRCPCAGRQLLSLPRQRK